MAEEEGFALLEPSFGFSRAAFIASVIVPLATITPLPFGSAISVSNPSLLILYHPQHKLVIYPFYNLKQPPLFIWMRLAVSNLRHHNGSYMSMIKIDKVANTNS